jgi:hypothetical protein
MLVVREADGELLIPQPFQRVAARGLIQHGLQRIRFVCRTYPVCHSEQVQVVIAEHALRRIAKAHQGFEHASRVLSAVHHVTQNVEHVTAWREINLAK